MTTTGGLIDACLVIRYSYRTETRIDYGTLVDVLGGTNHGSNEIHLHFEHQPQNERLERLELLCERERQERERCERERQEHERREREQREREQQERERRECEYERERRRRERRRYEELHREIRALCCVVILLIIVLWRA
jgi:hypothetical protein